MVQVYSIDFALGKEEEGILVFHGLDKTGAVGPVRYRQGYR